MELKKLNIRHVFIFIYFLTPTTNSLNLDDGRFTLLEPGPTNIFLTSSDSNRASQAFYLDESRSHYAQNYSLTLTTSMSSPLEGFTGELSLMLLTLSRSGQKGVGHMPHPVVEVVVRRGNYIHEYTDEQIPDVPNLPNSTISKKHIFKSWDFLPNQGNRSIEIKLSNWLGSVYMIATSYSYGSSPSSSCPPDSWWGHSDWWDCRSGDLGSSTYPIPLCVNYDLTCDDLPHCAQQHLPNSDENCEVHIGLMEVLELIIYTLMAILLLLIVSALAKCFIRRRHIGRPLSGGNARRHNEIRELFAAAHRIQRPANAPPTYDDAMKFVNDGFDQENIQEAPPEYNPTPAPGEETYAADAMDAFAGSDVSIPASMSSPTSAAIPSSSISDMVPVQQEVFPEPVRLVGEDNNAIDTGKAEALNTGLAVNVVGLTCFENNFIDIPLGELPKDPPAYSYLP